MRSLRLTLLLAVVAAAIAAAGAVAAPKASPPPVAHASGGDVTTILLPAVVNTHLVRTQKLLDDAAKYQDVGDDANEVKALTALRSNLKKTWAGDKFYIANAPPPPAAEAGLRVQTKVKVKTTAKAKAKAKAVAKAKAKRLAKANANASGGAVVAAASPYADIYTTTAAVLTLQHTIAGAMLSMLDTASQAVIPGLNSTLFGALNSRDTAIAYIHSLPPPPAQQAGIKVSAHASGGAVVLDWSTVMGAIVPDTADELMLINGLSSGTMGTISTTRTRLLNLAELQVTRTASKVNLWWPPVPPAA